MIIPTPEFDPMFADDGIPFRTKMLDHIEQEFSDILGNRWRLLNSQSGLDRLAQQVSSDVFAQQVSGDLSELRSNEAA